MVAFMTIVAIYVYIGLLNFGNHRVLTPLFFRNGNGTFYFYLLFAADLQEGD